jgi:hypothetical protein
VDWKDILLVLGPLAGFLGGLVTNALQKVFPAYSDLLKENADLRAELLVLREKNQGLYDALEDDM